MGYRETETMKTHVVFINPGFSLENSEIIRRKNYNDFPLNLALLATHLLDKGYTSEIQNANIHADWAERTLRALERTDVAYAGFSCMSSQVKSAIDLCKKIRERFPSLPIVWGGVHPTLLPETLVRTLWVDYCVVGEGDAVVEPLIDLANGKIGVGEVPNLVYRKSDGSIGRTPKAPQTTFERLPTRMHESLYRQDKEKYIAEIEIAGGRFRQFSVLTGLGCKYHCAFCINHVTRRAYRSKPASSIHQEMKFLKDNFGINFFVFQEEHFFSDRSRLLELLDLIERDGELFGKIRWTTTVRVSDIREDYLDVSLLRRIAKAGCTGLGTGGESGSDRVLKLLRKGTTRKDILRAARFCNDAGLMLSFSFVMLWPGETPEEMSETAKLIDEILRMGPYAHIPYFQTYRPYPGSIWEPDLSRFENPESLPDDVWRFQMVDPDRVAAFPNPRHVYRMITTTQILCLAGDIRRSSARPVHKAIGDLLFHMCSLRIRRNDFRLFLEKPAYTFLRKRFSDF